MIGEYLIACFCRKQKYVPLSTAETELFAQSESVNESKCVRLVLEELGFDASFCGLNHGLTKAHNGVLDGLSQAGSDASAHRLNYGLTKARNRAIDGPSKSRFCSKAFSPPIATSNTATWLLKEVFGFVEHNKAGGQKS